MWYLVGGLVVYLSLSDKLDEYLSLAGWRKAEKRGVLLHFGTPKGSSTTP